MRIPLSRLAALLMATTARAGSSPTVSDLPEDPVEEAAENAEDLLNAGVDHLEHHRFAEARALFQQTVAMSTSHRGEVGEIRRMAQSRLCEIEGIEGRSDVAEACLRRILTLVSRPPGSGLEIVVHAARLGVFLYERGRYAEAEHCFRLAADAVPYDPYDRAYFESVVAATLVDQDRLAEAFAFSSAALFRNDGRGRQGPAVLVHHAKVLGALGKRAEADDMLERARARDTASPDVDAAAYGTKATAMSWALWSFGRRDEAESLNTKVLAARERDFGPDHLRVAGPLLLRAATHRHHGRLEAAAHDARRALHIRERHLGPYGLLVQEALLAVAKAELGRGDREEAESALIRALALSTTEPVPSTQQAILENYAKLLGAQGRVEAQRRALLIAHGHFQERLALAAGLELDARPPPSVSTAVGEAGGREPAYDPTERFALELRYRDAVARIDQGWTSDAEDALWQVEEDQLAALGPDHPDLVATRVALAQTLELEGDLEGARELWHRAVAGHLLNPVDVHRGLVFGGYRDFLEFEGRFADAAVAEGLAR